MITDVPGIEVGHADDRDALTGCTVVLCGEGAVVGVDVRGLAPGTRETDLCRPGTLVERAQAVLLAGGSAFGLDAAAGVMRFLHERGRGFPTGVMSVPIVPGAVIFDLGIGSASWPDAQMGYQACLAAASGRVERGCVGAGTGASVGHIMGPAGAMKSGIGSASVRAGAAVVGALVVVNAFGDVTDPETGRILAGARDPETNRLVDTAALLLDGAGPAAAPLTSTTIGVIVTDAALTADQVSHLASAGHDGLARTIRPVHTLFDGDTLFALATGAGGASGSRDVPALAAAAVRAVERAVIDAVRTARPMGGLPCAASLRDVPGP